MNVVSLFDGISCGRIALERAGFKIKKYFASEIDKPAIKVSSLHYPDNVQMGDITKIRFRDGWFITPNKAFYMGKVDVLMGGSPCQGFSFAGKQLNFEDPRSKLFFEFIRLLNEVKLYNPNVKFLLENVMMKKDYQDVISKHLFVNPININSSLVSAQNRVRLYWTNIMGVVQPEDRGILLKDILENIDQLGPGAIRGIRLENKGTILGRRIGNDGKRHDYDKTIPVKQCLEVRATNRDKSNCLTTVDKDNVLTSMPIGRHIGAFENKFPFRYYTKLEKCRLQTMPECYLDSVSESAATKMTGNGWTVDVIAHIFSFMNNKNSPASATLFNDEKEF